jgi:hypothetical protein
LATFDKNLGELKDVLMVAARRWLLVGFVELETGTQLQYM